MTKLFELWDRPEADELYMIAGWRQWADAGDVSSGLPEYLINQTLARTIGEIRSDSFYLFQIPGAHHLMRPEVKLEDGYRKSITSRTNKFYYAKADGKGLVLFLGEEPHLNVEQYADAFLDVVEELGIRSVATVGGVYGAMPYDRAREISCVYSLPRMKANLAHYALKFSDYEGGSTIGTFLVHKAEERGIELVDFYAFVPNYDFTHFSSSFQGLRVERDFRAWYDLMHRFNHLFGLGINLSELRKQSEELVVSMAMKIDELDREAPQLEAKAYIASLAEEFTEQPFTPLDDVWERELGDLFDDIDDDTASPAGTS